MKGDRIIVHVADVTYKDEEVVEPDNWPPLKGDVWGFEDKIYFAHGTGWGSIQMRIAKGGQIPPGQMLYVFPDIKLLWRKIEEE